MENSGHFPLPPTNGSSISGDHNSVPAFLFHAGTRFLARVRIARLQSTGDQKKPRLRGGLKGRAGRTEGIPRLASKLAILFHQWNLLPR